MKKIIVGGVGGSGTRVIMMLLEELGFNLGDNINKTYDELSFELILQQYAHKAIEGIYTEKMEYEISRKLGRFKGRAWKNGWNMLYIPLYEKISKGCKYIHIIRDGRDAIYSPNPTFGRVMIKHRITFYKLANMWSRANMYADTTGKEILGDRYHLIKLEDLCFDSTVELLRLLDFLEIDHSHISKLLEIIKPPETFGRWRGGGATRIKKINNIMRPALKHFGYKI